MSAQKYLNILSCKILGLAYVEYASISYCELEGTWLFVFVCPLESTWKIPWSILKLFMAS